MEEEYIKEIKIIEKSQEDKELELILSIIKTKQDLNLAMHNFEYAEGDLIDYYTYQMKANHFLCNASLQGIIFFFLRYLQ